MNAPIPATHEYANRCRADAAKMLAGKGCVYCIGPVAGPLKIGWSTDPEKRLSELQTGNAETLVIHAIFPGSQAIERGLHELFADQRLRGEWFRNDRNEIVETVRGLLDQFFPEVTA